MILKGQKTLFCSFSSHFQNAGGVNFKTTRGVENNVKVEELMKEGELSFATDS